jgi:hypothetical protein
MSKELLISVFGTSFFNMFYRKVSAGRKGESVTEAQLLQKQNSSDENVQDIFLSPCNITCIDPGGKKHVKAVLATVPVVAANKSKSKKTDAKSNR